MYPTNNYGGAPPQQAYYAQDGQPYGQQATGQFQLRHATARARDAERGRIQSRGKEGGNLHE